MTTMTQWNTRGALARLCLTLLVLAPLCACDCESATSGGSGGDIPFGFSVEGILIIEPGSGYEVGDDISFGSGLLKGAGAGATAFVAEVDAGGGVLDIEITNPGLNYLVAPSVTVTSAAGKGCVLLSDIRVVEICLDNELEVNINGTMHLAVQRLFGAESLEIPVSAICFSELGSDECFFAVNGTFVLSESQELEVSVFTTTLNEFVELEDHLIKAAGEGLVLTHKNDLDGDGVYEIAEGEITFHTALGGALQLTGATIDGETDSFASGLDGLLDGSMPLAGSISFGDCD
jgi:hypothetical protein